MKRIIVGLLLLGLGLLPLSAQQSIQQTDADFLIKNAERAVETFGGYLTLIGASYTESDERQIAIARAMDVIQDYYVRIDNDLDPTGRLQRYLQAEQYLKSIRTFYREESGVRINLSNFRTNGAIYFNGKKKEYFVKVTATRDLKGEFYTADGPKENSSVQDIDYFVTVLKDGRRTKVTIFQVSKHAENAPRGYPMVKINEKSELIFDPEEKEAIQAQLAQSERDVKSLRNQLNSERERRQAAERAQTAAEARQLTEMERNKALEKELGAVKATVFAAGMRQESAERIARARTLERDEAKAEAKKWRKKAFSSSRATLQLGGSLVGFVANENSESIESYSGTLALGYRIWGKKKGKRMSGWTLMSMLNVGQTPYNVAPRLRPEIGLDIVQAPLLFAEIEAGFYIQQLFRISAGRGQFYYDRIGNTGNVERETLPYYIGTIGLSSPPVGTIPVLGFNVSYLTQTFPLGGKDPAAFFNTLQNQAGEIRLDFFLRFQLE